MILKRRVGVQVATTTYGPDGETTVLPPESWEMLMLAVVDGELDSDASDFLAWEREHHALGPKRAANPTAYRSPTADCPDCSTPPTGPKVYCQLHRCRATKANGQPCRLPADERHAGMYCGQHGCQHVLAVPGVLCPNQMAKGSYRCADHLNIGEFAAGRKRIT